MKDDNGIPPIADMLAGLKVRFAPMDSVEKTYKLSKKGYYRRKRTGEYLHRDIWIKVHGQPVLDGHQIHHIDEKKRNNHPDNLEVLTQAQHSAKHVPKRNK